MNFLIHPSCKKSFYIPVVLLVAFSFVICEKASADNKNRNNIPNNASSTVCNEIWKTNNFILSNFTDWTVQDTGKYFSSLTANIDKTVNNKGVFADFKRGMSISKPPAVILKSDELSSYKFNDVSEVTIRHKSGVDGKIRVVLKDANNKSFFSKAAITTRFKDWVDTRRSYSPETIGFFSVNSPELKPPFRISHIMFVLPKSSQDGQFGISELTVRGNFEKLDKEESTYSSWLYKVCTKSADDSLELSVSSKAGDTPIDININVDFQISAIRQQLKGQLKTNFELNVDIEGYGTGTINVLKQPVIVKEDINIVRKISYKFTEPGLYALVARLISDDGEVISKKSKILTVWNPPGNKYSDNKPYFFGMMYPIDRFPKTRIDDLRLLKKAGVKVVRFPFRWSDIEIEKGKYEWASTDGIMSALKDNDFIAEPMVFYTPDWASKSILSVLSAKSLYLAYKRPRWIMPKEPLDFAGFLTSVALRYKRQAVVWEVWNEPTETQHWIGGDVYDYMSMLRLSVESFQANSIDADILSAGIGIIAAHDQRFSSVLANPGSDIDFDYAIHSYSSDSGAVQSVNIANELIVKSPYHKEVWLNETGYLVDPRDAAGELRRSAALVKTASVARYMNLKNFTWFIFRNFAASAKMVTDNYAIIDSDGTVRPPLVAYAHTVNMLVDVTPVSKSETPEAVQIYVFARGDKRVAVMWLDSEHGDVSILLQDIEGYKVESISTMFGNEITGFDQNGKVRITHSPLFVTYDAI